MNPFLASVGHRPARGDFFEDLLRVATLQDYNTRVVILGTMLLGLAAGIVGCFMLLRKRALVGDALSHATLPGIGIAFIVLATLGLDTRSLPALLLGATVSSLLGMAFVLGVRKLTRLKEDAALGIVLSVFFGLGIAVLGVIQGIPGSSSAGLKTFILGRTANMLFSDAMLIAGAAGVTVLLAVALYKEFALVCFDEAFAASLGWRVLLIDALMMGLVIAVTVIGLKAVGLILIIALLVIPAAAARFWTNHLPSMIAVAAAIGAVSGVIGSALSALLEDLPAGAVIVVVAGALFAVSMVFGRSRGVLVRALEHRRLARKVAEQNLLRGLYEAMEVGDAQSDASQPPSAPRAAPAALEAAPGATAVSLDTLQSVRGWSPRQLRVSLRRARRDGLVEEAGPGLYRLTAHGLEEARRIVRNHRLWETFLIAHADIAPAQVDQAADDIEHVIGAEMVRELEALLEGQAAAGGPALAPVAHPGASSPHELGGPRVAAGANPA